MVKKNALKNKNKQKAQNQFVTHQEQSAHRQQRGPGGAGVIRNVLLPCQDVLEVPPHILVEDHVEEEDEDSLKARKSANKVCHADELNKESDGLRRQTGGAGVQVGGCARGYLQAAEDSEQVVEGHHVAVDRHQAKQPGGADEQQEDEGHAESGAEDGWKHTEVKWIWNLKI